jgi:hypothetical protein
MCVASYRDNVALDCWSQAVVETASPFEVPEAKSMGLRFKERFSQHSVQRKRQTI